MPDQTHIWRRLAQHAEETHQHRMVMEKAGFGAKPKKVHHPNPSWAPSRTDRVLVSPSDRLRAQKGGHFRPVSTRCTPAMC